MKRITGLLCAALLAFAPTFAAASVTTTGAGKAPGGGGGGGYSGPGDIVSGAVQWYGLRAYSAAVAASGTAKAIKVHNTSTSENCDVLINSSGGLGNTTACSGASSGTAVATFCGANCTVTTWYDQVNGYNMLSLGTDATLAFNCVNTTLPCVVFAGAQGYESFGNPSNTSQPLSLSAVAIRTGNATAQNDILSASNGVFFTSTSGQIGGFFGSAPSVAASESNWHAVQWVVNGSSSEINVDGTRTTSLGFGAGALNTTDFYMAKQVGGSFLTGKIAEAGVWPATSFSSTQQANLCHNQFAYWGTVTSC